jgi:hypothetical protein
MIQTQFTPDHYVGTGAIRNYAFTFRILKKSDLLVETLISGGTPITLVLDSDYTIAASSVNNSAGGQIVLTTDLALNTEIFLTRQTAMTQLVHIEEGAPFPSSVVEEVFDRLTMFAQELKYLARQTLHFPTASLFKDITVEDPEAGQILRWNSTEDAVENVLASALAITHTVIDVVLAPADLVAVITHNLNDSNAKIIGFSSTYHTAFKLVSQTANAITVGLTDEAPAGGGTLTFEVAI